MDFYLAKKSVFSSIHSGKMGFKNKTRHVCLKVYPKMTKNGFFQNVKSHAMYQTFSAYNKKYNILKNIFKDYNNFFTIKIFKFNKNIFQKNSFNEKIDFFSHF